MIKCIVREICILMHLANLEIVVKRAFSWKSPLLDQSINPWSENGITHTHTHSHLCTHIVSQDQIWKPSIVCDTNYILRIDALFHTGLPSVLVCKFQRRRMKLPNRLTFCKYNVIVTYWVGSVGGQSHMITIRSRFELTLNQLEQACQADPGQEEEKKER